MACNAFATITLLYCKENLVIHPKYQYNETKKMNNQTREAVILWASYYEELTAISFLHEFRQMGLQVSLVATHSSSEMQSTEILSPPRQTLQDAFARAKEIACIVIPASIAALNQFQQEPLLWQLVGAVHQNGGRVIIGPPEGASKSEAALLLPPAEQMMTFPKSAKLLLFARWLAHLLMTGETLAAPRWEDSAPPLVKVATGSNPSVVAGAMAGIVREYGYAEAQAVGAAAGNQMLKAAAIAKSYLERDKMALFVVPDFVNVQIGDTHRSAIRLFICAWPRDMENRVSCTQWCLLEDAGDD